MQEFVFTVTYDRGSDPIADVLIGYPDVVMTLLDCSVTADSVWFLNRITGPAAALDRLDDIFLDSTHCNECLSAELCSTDWTYELLSSGETSRTVYSYGTDGEDCHSIPGLGVAHLGDGLVHDAERRGDQYRWRILVPDDAALGDLYDRISSGLRDGLRLSLDHLKEPTRWGDTVVSLADVPYEQRTTLRAAVERGYYETPERNYHTGTRRRTGHPAVDGPVSAVPRRGVARDGVRVGTDVGPGGRHRGVTT